MRRNHLGYVNNAYVSKISKTSFFPVEEGVGLS